MSGVDVLAVLDREIEAIRNTKQIVDYSLSPERQGAYAEHLESLIESRAAVAELIDAAAPLEELWDAGCEIDVAIYRVASAVARCRGGAA